MYKAIFCACAVLFYAVSSKAENWLEESKAFGAWDLMPAFEVALKSQRVEIQLEYDRYSTDIYYQLSPLGDRPLKGKMVFPVLCIQSINSKQGEDKTVEPCIHNFEVELNETKLEAESIESREISDIGYLLYDHQTIRKISDLAAQGYSQSGTKNSLAGNRILLKLYVFEVPEEILDLNVHVRYSAPYYHYVSGSNESPFNYYSNDTVFYGFSSASRWVIDKLEQISVKVDASKVYGEISFSEGLKLKLQDGVYSFEDKKVNLNKLKPLVIRLDRRKEKQYKQFVLNQSKVQQEITLTDLDSDQSDLSSLSDGDLGTAWCRDGRTAHLKLTIKKPQENSLCLFSGVGIINGYAETMETMKNYSRIKSADYSVKGVERFSQDSKIIQFTDKSILQDKLKLKRWNPYELVRYFTNKNNNENFISQSNEVALTEGAAAEVELNEDIEIELKVLDIYKGRAENVCISEVKPLYHCY